MSSLDLLHFNPITFTFAALVFFSLLLILSAKVWKPILKALDERDETIRQDLDQAKSSKEGAEKLLEEQKRVVSEMKAENKKMREEAVALAEKQKGEMIASAKNEAEQIITKAKADFEKEKTAAFEAFKALAVEVGVELAKKLISSEINKDTHEKVIQSSIIELEEAYKKAS